MTDNKYEVADLINYTFEKKPIEFENAFNDVVIDRIRTAVEDKKLEIAQQMYGYEPPEELDTDNDDDEFGVDNVEAEDSEEDYDG